jgi:hypothetical protein
MEYRNNGQISTRIYNHHQKGGMHMARTASESPFIRRATRIGLEQLLADVEMLLATHLSEAQRIANDEMRKQIKAQLEKYKEEAK